MKNQLMVRARIVTRKYDRHILGRENGVENGGCD